MCVLEQHSYVFAEFVKSDTLVQCSFDFFLDLPAKTLTFESLFGRLLARNTLNSKCFSWEVYEKVNKNIERQLTRPWETVEIWLQRSYVATQHLAT